LKIFAQKVPKAELQIGAGRRKSVATDFSMIQKQIFLKGTADENYIII